MKEWRNLFRRGRPPEFANSLPPAGANPERPHRYVDLGYEILADEVDLAPEGLVRCEQRRYLLLSQIDANPLPYLGILVRRIDQGEPRQTYFTLPHVFRSAFLRLEPVLEAGKASAKPDLRKAVLLHSSPSYSSIDWNYADNILVAGERSLYGERPPAPDRRGEQTLLDRWEALRSDGEIRFTRLRAPHCPAELDPLLRYAGTTEFSSSALPAAVRNRLFTALAPYLVEETRTYPLSPFLDELQWSMERGIAFAAYFHTSLLNRVQSRHTVSYPKELLGLAANAWHPAIDRERLLAEIRLRFPGFAFHRALKDAAITRSEAESALPRETKASIEAYQQSSAAHERDLETRRTVLTLEPQGLPPAILAERDPDSQLHLYWKHFDIQLEAFRFQVASPPISPEHFSSYAYMLAQELPQLKSTWTSLPTISPEDEQRFWERRVWTEYESGSRGATGDSLRYALFSPPYGSTDQWMIELADTDLLERLFRAPLHAEEWVVYRVDPTASSYFINEWWDYFWIAFSRDGELITVLYGTATD